MITWFDAVLVTLLAAATALGALRGLAGLAWGVGCVAVCFLSNFFFAGWPALVLAAVLGVGIAWGARRLNAERQGAELEIWHLGAGALGGLLIGTVLIGTLALSLPIDPVTNQYPSSSLPTAVHDAVANSYLKDRFFKVFTADNSLKTLFIPDYSRR